MEAFLKSSTIFSQTSQNHYINLPKPLPNDTDIRNVVNRLQNHKSVKLIIEKSGEVTLILKKYYFLRWSKKSRQKRREPNTSIPTTFLIQNVNVLAPKPVDLINNEVVENSTFSNVSKQA